MDLVSTCVLAGYLVRYKSSSSELGYTPNKKDVTND